MPGKPGTGKPATAGKPASSAPPASDPELLQLAEEKAAALGVAQAQIARLASTQQQLDAAAAAAAAELAAERQRLGDVVSHLQRSLAEQTARATAAERGRAEAQAALSEARAEAGAAAAAAAERQAAEAGAAAAALEAQRDRMAQANAFLAERDGLRAAAEGLREQLEEAKRQHTKRHMELERQHAADRELWRRDTAEAVQQAREEMAALTDQRLDATTKATLIENEEMAGELQYQGRHVQGLLARNAELQKQAAGQRVALGIGRDSEADLARKLVACERTVESLLARLEEVEGAHAESASAAAGLAAQLAAAQEAAHTAQLQAAARAAHAEEVEGELSAARAELRRGQEEHEGGASFLLACLADVRQELLAEQGHAALAAAGPPHAQPDGGARQSASGSAAASPLVLAELPLRQREEALRRLLDRLSADWGQREGLVLPARGPASRPGKPGAAAARAGSPAVQAAAAPAAVSPMPPAAAPSRTVSASVRSGCASAGCTRSELLEMLLSDVRPWGQQGRPASSSVPAAAAGVPAAGPAARLESIRSAACSEDGAV